MELPARPLGRRLDVEPAVDQAGDGLEVPLRLAVAAGVPPTRTGVPSGSAIR